MAEYPAKGKSPPATKGKTTKKSSPKFVDAGGHKMSGKNSAGPQTPGQSAQMGRGGGRFASGGGSGKMSGKNTAKNQTPA